MPRVRLPPLTALRGRATVIPTVGLPPVAGPTDGEHRAAPRPAAPHRAPRHGSGHRPCTPRRLRRVRRRRGVTGETDRPAWAYGGARPGVQRSRAHTTPDAGAIARPRPARPSRVSRSGRSQTRRSPPRARPRRVRSWRRLDPRPPVARASGACPAPLRQPHHAQPEQDQRQEQLPEQRAGRYWFRLRFGFGFRLRFDATATTGGSVPHHHHRHRGECGSPDAEQ